MGLGDRKWGIAQLREIAAKWGISHPGGKQTASSWKKLIEAKATSEWSVVSGSDKPGGKTAEGVGRRGGELGEEEGGEHGRDGSRQHCAPKGVDAFQILRLGDDDEVAGLDAELLQSGGVSVNMLHKFPPCYRNCRLIRLQVDDGWLIAIIL